MRLFALRKMETTPLQLTLAIVSKGQGGSTSPTFTFFRSRHSTEQCLRNGGRVRDTVLRPLKLTGSTSLPPLPPRLLSSGSLIIISPSVEDSATYECTVTNDAGQDKRTMTLNVQGKVGLAGTRKRLIPLCWSFSPLHNTLCRKSKMFTRSGLIPRFSLFLQFRRPWPMSPRTCLSLEVLPQWSLAQLPASHLPPFTGQRMGSDCSPEVKGTGCSSQVSPACTSVHADPEFSFCSQMKGNVRCTSTSAFGYLGRGNAIWWGEQEKKAEETGLEP